MKNSNDYQNYDKNHHRISTAMNHQRINNMRLQSDDSTFENEALDEHNRLRAIHGVPPLTLSRHLCNFAKEWAQYLASRNTMQHRSNSQYGENIYMSGGSHVDGRTAVTAWYSEIKDFRFGYGQFAMNTGHFTQVVWRDSTEMGIGIERRGNSAWVVANYSPPGNFQGRFAENVLPPQ